MTFTYRILLVEDEEHLLDAIKMNLEMEGYKVEAVKNGKEGLQTFHKARFDLVILDVMLPDMDGFTICQTIRLENTTVPILFLTAKDTSADRIQGLKLGADDYLNKPFNLEELLLRVKILLKRSGEHRIENADSQQFEFDGNVVDFSSFEIRKNGEKRQISQKEAKLLKLLIDNRKKVVSREEILEKVWGYDVYPSTRTIDNYILGFRKFFENDPRDPKYFLSVRGVGYRFAG